MGEIKQKNVEGEVGEIPIDLEQDVTIVLRHREEGDDFYFHIPPFKGTNLDFPPHIGTAIAICSCLYYQDKEFHELVKKKFEEYGAKYLEHIFPDKWEEQNP